LDVTNSTNIIQKHENMTLCDVEFCKTMKKRSVFAMWLKNTVVLSTIVDFTTK